MAFVRLGTLLYGSPRQAKSLQVETENYVSFSCILIVLELLSQVLILSSNSRLVDLLSRCSQDAKFKNFLSNCFFNFLVSSTGIFNTLFDTKNLDSKQELVFQHIQIMILTPCTFAIEFKISFDYSFFNAWIVELIAFNNWIITSHSYHLG